MTQTLVTVQMRFPTIDPEAVADLVSPVLTAATAAGGLLTSITVQPYEAEDE